MRGGGGKQQTGTRTSMATSVQKRGQHVLCLAAQSAPGRVLERLVCHWQAEIEGRVLDRSLTGSRTQTQLEVDGCRHAPRVQAADSSWLSPLTCSQVGCEVWHIHGGLLLSCGGSESLYLSERKSFNCSIALPLPPTFPHLWAVLAPLLRLVALSFPRMLRTP